MDEAPHLMGICPHPWVRFPVNRVFESIMNAFVGVHHVRWWVRYSRRLERHRLRVLPVEGYLDTPSECQGADVGCLVYKIPSSMGTNQWRCQVNGGQISVMLSNSTKPFAHLPP